MGTHLIPREIDGDARILLIFTPKGFIGTLIGIGAGAFLYTMCTAFGANIVGWVLLFFCAAVGFIIGQVKIPESNAFPLFKKVGGLNVSEVITSYFAFKRKRKIYLYDQTSYGKEEQNVVTDEAVMPITTSSNSTLSDYGSTSEYNQGIHSNL